jgi:hypothetical protein
MEEYKLKWQCLTTIHLRTLAAPNSDEDLVYQIFQFHADFIDNVEDILVSPYKTKFTLTIWSSNCAPFTKMSWYLCVHKSLRMNIYSSFVIYQNLEI